MTPFQSDIILIILPMFIERNPIMKQYNLKMTNTVPTDWKDIERADVDSYVWGGAELAHKTYGQLVYA